MPKLPTRIATPQGEFMIVPRFAVRSFWDTDDALRFLHRSVADGMPFSMLREIVRRKDPDARWMSRPALMRRAAELLARGRLRLVRVQGPITPVDELEIVDLRDLPGDPDAPANIGGSEAPKRGDRPGLTFVEFSVVDDRGQPLPAAYLCHINGIGRDGEYEAGVVHFGELPLSSSAHLLLGKFAPVVEPIEPFTTGELPIPATGELPTAGAGDVPEPTTGELPVAYRFEIVDESGEPLVGEYTLSVAQQQREGSFDGGTIAVTDLPPGTATLEVRVSRRPR